MAFGLYIINKKQLILNRRRNGGEKVKATDMEETQFDYPTQCAQGYTSMIVYTMPHHSHLQSGVSGIYSV